MSKAPSFQFYPSDWIRDLDEHPLEIEGAWIRICCKLFYSETCGMATKTLEKWARILRTGVRRCQTIIDYLDKQNIADVINQNGDITITSRRMVKDEYIRNIRRNAGSRGGNPALKKMEQTTILDNQNLDNQNPTTGVNQNPTPSSSSSSSSSIKKEKILSLGSFGNVKLSESEHEKLIGKFGEDGTTEKIEKLSQYVASKGKKYKSHYATILMWASKDGGSDGKQGIDPRPDDPFSRFLREKTGPLKN